MDLKTYIRSFPHFPKRGVLFRDIMPMLHEPAAWRYTIDELRRRLELWQPDILIGVEARGFLLAAPLAYAMGLGFSLVRKPGKLPGPLRSIDYDLEYGSNRLEMQEDAVTPGTRVAIVDDLLATGGTTQATCALMEQANAQVVGTACIVELSALAGRQRLTCPVETLVVYDD
ncbi:MAG: adenine phosphoribosyltransferase [Pseudomonadota bacterium]